VSSEPAAVRLCRSWARIYTRGLPAEIGERRVLEIESDLWEHLHDPADGRLHREILGRTLRGIHADVWWRYRTLLEQRGARHRSHDVTTTTRQNWWTPVTTVLGVVVATMGLLGLVGGEPTTGSGGALLLAAAPPAIGGLLILGGLAARRRRVVLGSRLVIAGAVLAAFDPIFIPAAALVIIGGLWSGNLAVSGDRADAIRLDVIRRSMTDGWYRWLVAAVVLAVFGFGVVGIADAATDTESCTETEPCWEGTAIWATWVISWLAAMVTGGIGIVLGVLRLITRHHTRPA
jgi:hypothetical protein